MNIDWSKAPEWAVAHGLHETGFGIKEFWLGETQHQNLEHAKSFPYGGGDSSRGSFHNSRRESFSYVTPRPTPWTGEGLPPVGIEIEAMMCRNMHDGYAWHRAKVVHGPLPGSEGEVLVFCLETTSPAWVDEFRPVRTPEQIAFEARDNAVKEMLAVWNAGFEGHVKDGLYALYDASYRKQVAS